VSARRRHRGDLRWEGVEVERYKAESDSHREVTRQLLFGADADLPCELRYFEIGSGGHSTLERHAHAHAVVVVRGRGRALVGGELVALEPFDLLRVPPGAWHQLRADRGAPLGFLCLVAGERDRPRRPSARERAALETDPAIARFLRGE
jgi:quercetin dioxygenase-like cupin family protein